MIPACITARAWRTCRDACRDRLSAVPRKTFPALSANAHPQFYVSSKRPIPPRTHCGLALHIWIISLDRHDFGCLPGIGSATTHEHSWNEILKVILGWVCFILNKSLLHYVDTFQFWYTNYTNKIAQSLFGSPSPSPVKRPGSWLWTLIYCESQNVIRVNNWNGLFPIHGFCCWCI